MRPRRSAGHMTTHAIIGVSCGCQNGVGFRAMAGHALAVVKGGILSAQRIVWIVAGEAGEAIAALAKTGALGQVERLMPCIPRFTPVGGRFARLGLAMTRAAELIQGDARHPPWVLNSF